MGSDNGGAQRVLSSVAGRAVVLMAPFPRGILPTVAWPYSKRFCVPPCNARGLLGFIFQSFLCGNGRAFLSKWAHPCRAVHSVVKCNRSVHSYFLAPPPRPCPVAMMCWMLRPFTAVTNTTVKCYPFRKSVSDTCMTHMDAINISISSWTYITPVFMFSVNFYHVFERQGPCAFVAICTCGSNATFV